jgi:ABC-type cobalt transport system substrate-binding protein
MRKKNFSLKSILQPPIKTFFNPFFTPPPGLIYGIYFNVNPWIFLNIITYLDRTFKEEQNDINFKIK